MPSSTEWVQVLVNHQISIHCCLYHSLTFNTKLYASVSYGYWEELYRNTEKDPWLQWRVKEKLSFSETVRKPSVFELLWACSVFVLPEGACQHSHHSIQSWPCLLSGATWPDFLLMPAPVMMSSPQPQWLLPEKITQTPKLSIEPNKRMLTWAEQLLGQARRGGWRCRNDTSPPLSCPR